jgi:hypothetical protein
MKARIGSIPATIDRRRDDGIIEARIRAHDWDRLEPQISGEGFIDMLEDEARGGEPVTVSLVRDPVIEGEFARLELATEQLPGERVRSGGIP